MTKHSLKVAGLFAGIGGIELGLQQAGHHSSLLCELDPGAHAVLAARFPEAKLTRDVREITSIGSVDLLAAGFPCQDLSQAGRTAGIGGRNSGLVGHVFRLLDAAKRKPRWLMLENVSFMLQLEKGRGMRHLVGELESRGFNWAYRVVDTLAFGLPQRRQRVILLASRTDDPRAVLFADDEEPVVTPFKPGLWCGFYWTEGLRGLGWAVDAVPTLKGGSTVGIPSPPAIWDSRDGSITTPDIRDAERLQGFDADWTLPALAVEGVRRGHRWKLVGNAVSVPVARWVGQRLPRLGASTKSRLTGVGSGRRVVAARSMRRTGHPECPPLSTSRCGRSHVRSLAFDDAWRGLTSALVRRSPADASRTSFDWADDPSLSLDGDGHRVSCKDSRHAPCVA